MKIIREFLPADRYAYDFGPCSSANGFAQIDTRQDAHYYGTWCSPDKRAIVNYCEGDVTTTICDDDAEFVAELRRLKTQMDESGWGPVHIDPGLDPSFRDRFVSLGVQDLLHPDPDMERDDA